MKFSDLIDYLSNRMRMAHIYQPLLIRALIDSGGSATIRQIAHIFLEQDESQLQYYQKRVKEMPVQVLKRNGIVERDGELITLNLDVSKLSLEQKSQLRQLCEEKLHEFIQKRGLGIWDHRMIEDDPVPDSLRYQVLAASVAAVSSVEPLRKRDR